MPGGLENPIAGYLAFNAVKFGGYTFAAWRLNRSYPDNSRNVIAVGATRTGIGVAFGYLVAILFLPLVFDGTRSWLFAYVVFVPIRFLEWWLILLILNLRGMKGEQDAGRRSVFDL